MCYNVSGRHHLLSTVFEPRRIVYTVAQKNPGNRLKLYWDSNNDGFITNLGYLWFFFSLDDIIFKLGHRGGSRNFHLGRPVKGPSKFWVGQQEWCTWGRISFG